MYLKKAQAGSAPGVVWHEDGDVQEVPDDLGWQLLDIPFGGFTMVEPEPEPEPELDNEPEPESAVEPESETEETPKRRGRPPLPRDENGEIIRD